MRMVVPGLMLQMLLALGVSGQTVPMIDLSKAQPTERVSPMLFGLNLSYFNDLDSVWEAGDLAAVYRRAGIGALRYPGGEETSRFHWETPGVTGYIDLWNPEHHDQKWQSLRVPRDRWETFEGHMDFDEFMAAAEAVEAEPLVGINMSSGVVMGRAEDSIAEAVRWIRYVKEKGYPVTYWYLDNEPWHTEDHNYVHIPLEDYARLCVRFVDAMRAVDPGAKFIANPLEGGRIGNWKALEPFMNIAGGHVDVLDYHWYWEWGNATWETWLASKPMRHSSKWRPYEKAETFTELIRRTQRHLREHGYPDVSVAALEWNVSPPKDRPLRPNRAALMHGELLLQFADAGLEMACVWPGFWEVMLVPGPSEDRAWIEHAPPHRPRAALDVVQMLSVAGGGERLDGPGLSTQSASPTLAVRSANGSTVYVFVLNKDETAATLSIQRGATSGHASATSFTESGGQTSLTLNDLGGGGVRVTLPPHSLTRIDLPAAGDQGGGD